MRASKVALIVAIAAAVAVFLALGGPAYLTFESIKAQQAAIQAYHAAHPWQSALLYFALYVAVTGLSLPGRCGHDARRRRHLRPRSGARSSSRSPRPSARRSLFSPRASCCATGCSAGSASRCAPSTAAWSARAPSTSSRLRLIPVIPFFAINLAMGLTPHARLDVLLGEPARHARGHPGLRERRPQLAAIDSPAGILSPALIGAFVLLGLFPLVAKKIVEAAKARRVYARWAGKKPAAFDRNLVVIGAGSAGLVTAYIAAAVKAKVTLVENAPHGRRLPEHGLRALQGAHQERAGACDDPARRRVRTEVRPRRVRLRAMSWSGCSAW